MRSDVCRRSQLPDFNLFHFGMHSTRLVLYLNIKFTLLFNLFFNTTLGYVVLCNYIQLSIDTSSVASNRVVLYIVLVAYSVRFLEPKNVR